jgi:hypothetical protein
MVNDVKTAPQPAVTELLTGIVSDIGALIRQEVRFARTEIKSDFQKSRTAVVLLASGAATAALGALLLALMLVFLLHYITLPNTAADPAQVPLWGCFGLVSLLFLVVGGALVWAGVAKFQSFNPLPDETVKTVEENVSWIANTSSK